MVNFKQVRRLYAEERLQVKYRKSRKKASGTRAPLVTPRAPEQRWSTGLRLRCLRCGSPLPGVGRDRRLQRCMPLPRRRYLALRAPGRSRAGPAHHCSQTAGDDCLGQWHRVHQQGNLALVAGPPDRMAPDRAGKTSAERIHREFQSQAPRRVAERNGVLVPERSAHPAQTVVAQLKHTKTSRKARVADAIRVRRPQPPEQAMAQQGNHAVEILPKNGS